MHRLWYTRPAAAYMYGLPIGTGRLSAMVYGTTPTERLALNHEWLWRQRHRTREPDQSAHLLPEVRRLLLAGDHEAGAILGNDAFAGGGGLIRKTRPGRIDPYQPAGDLSIAVAHGAVSGYRRELDLAAAVATVRYEADGIAFTREYMAHLPSDLLLVRLRAGRPVDTRLALSRVEDPDCQLLRTTEPTRLALDGEFVDGMQSRIDVQVLAQDGSAAVDDSALVIAGATTIILAIDIGTSADGRDPLQECGDHRPPHADWQALRRAHVAAYRRHYDAVALDVDVPAPDRATDDRLTALHRAETDDPALAALYFNYGRYAHIAATATATLPPNLQGGWNDDIAPPWDCDYHLDINLQLNYWLAEPAGLTCGIEALLRFIDDLVPHARRCARDLYGCGGVCFPLQTDPWGRATPESYGWAAWIGAAPWLAQHLWWHYEYSLDATFLRERAYPFFVEVMDFYEDYLIAGADGRLHIVPSQSPENRFAESGRVAVSLCVDATMDVQLLESMLHYATRAAELLDCDAERRERWQAMRAQLPPYRIGSRGQLLEWAEEFREVDPSHRHMSHLFGVYPGDLYGPERRPDLYAAARVSLEGRLTDTTRGHIGWRDTWIALLYTRFGDRQEAWWWLCRLIDLHAPHVHLHEPHHTPLFQIEGLQGVTAAVSEMLLQSQHEELHLLPCLPPAWPDGTVRGLRARGGYTVDITWRGGALREARIRAGVERRCCILHGTQLLVRDDADDPVACERDGHRLRFTARTGQVYRLAPQPAAT